MLLLAALAAAAAPSAVMSALEPAFANTIVSTYPDGRQAKAWLNRDGTYRGQGRTGRVTSGRWAVKDGKICLRQQRPIPIPLAYCTEVREGGVGTTWTAKAVTGEAIRLELVAGR
jgi:hypothetical protein